MIFSFRENLLKEREGWTNFFSKFYIVILHISTFFQLTSVEEAKSKFRSNDFNKTVILQYLTNILDSPDMRRQNSVFLFNLGVHYPISLNFTTYRDLVDSVITLLRRKVEVQHNNKPIVIWKTTTSVEKEKTHLMFAELPRNKTHWRFHTHQV